ncbi:MAG: hypothetical protein AB1758_27840 [Candidatus Eremiobacterota bacterium]
MRVTLPRSLGRVFAMSPRLPYRAAVYPEQPSKFMKHQDRDMKNVTITLDEEVARWARIRAAEQNTSVSRLVGEMLRRHMQEEDAYDRAMADYLALKPAPLKRTGGYPRRDDLYER